MMKKSLRKQFLVECIERLTVAAERAARAYERRMRFDELMARARSTRDARYDRRVDEMLATLPELLAKLVAPPPAPPPPPEGWLCVCGTLNAPTRDTCASCEKMPPPRGAAKPQ